MAKQGKSGAPVELTQRAIAQIKKAIVRERQDKDEAGLRVLLVNAGNGHRYDLQFDKKPLPTDLVSTQGEIKVYVDQKVATFIQGTQLDFIETPRGAGFIFHPPGSKDRVVEGKSKK